MRFTTDEIRPDDPAATFCSCPDCGEHDRLASVEALLATAPCDVMVDTITGEFDVAWMGHVDVCWDSQTTEGFTCLNCMWEGPLEALVPGGLPADPEDRPAYPAGTYGAGAGAETETETAPFVDEAKAVIAQLQRAIDDLAGEVERLRELL